MAVRLFLGALATYQWWRKWLYLHQQQLWAPSCASNHCWYELTSTALLWLVWWFGWQVDTPWKSEPPLRNCFHQNHIFLIGNWYRRAQCTREWGVLGRWARAVLKQKPISKLIKQNSFKFLLQVPALPSSFFFFFWHGVYHKNRKESRRISFCRLGWLMDMLGRNFLSWVSWDKKTYLECNGNVSWANPFYISLH